MLDLPQLTSIFDRLGTPPAGRKLILDARMRAPVREVKSQIGNVITVLSSQKMRRDIRTESRHIEFAVAVEREYGPDVLEYYAQPSELKLELTDHATGEIRTITHFPDFLTIRNDGFTLEEWKSAAKLTRLAEKYPYRYSRSSDGEWYAPQIERQLSALGIRYRICSDESIPRRRVDNLLYLADYYLETSEACSADVLARLQDALGEHGALSFSELLAAPFSFNADELNKAIADHLVATDIDRESLSDKRSFHLYRDEVLRDFMLANGRTANGNVPGSERFVLNIAAGSKFEFEGQELTMTVVGDTSVICSKPDGSNIQLTRTWLEDAYDRQQIKVAPTFEQKATTNYSRYSKEDLEEALRRQAILDNVDDHGSASSRTLRRWEARRLVAMANGDNEITALIPHTSAKGNRTPRLSARQLELMDQVIDKYWLDSNAINYTACYKLMSVAFAEEGEKAPSYPTLIARIKARQTTADVRTRYGKRIAYQQDTFVDILYYDTPAHGSRPFQYVHIDHTELDIELISSRTGKPLGRPWLSLAVDAWSRRILAFYLTFDPPSYHSVMMVVRDLVRRFNRLPEFIVVDNGSDFLSDAFESFLKVMGTHMRFRPAGQPRHGAVLERMFGRLHTEYVHNLAGNTKATKNVRQVTGSHLPKKLAEWTLRTLYHGIQHWACEYYDENVHPALDESPREAFLRGLRENGSRPQRRISFNRDFLIATCPPVDRSGVRQIHRQRGVKVDHRFYWHEAFRSSQIAGLSLPVRYDPWDASTVFVRVKDTWVRALCRNLHGLGQLTDVERRAITAEYNKRHAATPDDDARAAQRLREFLQVFKPEGALALEFARQSENKALYNDLQFANVDPIALLPVRSELVDETPDDANTPAQPHSTTPTPTASPQDVVEQVEFNDFDDF